MSGEKMTVWITKWALGIRGIEKREVTDEGDGMVILREVPGHAQFFHAKDWHRTREDAIKAAEAMRKRKINSLKNQIENLKKLRVEQSAEQ